MTKQRMQRRDLKVSELETIVPMVRARVEKKGVLSKHENMIGTNQDEK